MLVFIADACFSHSRASSCMVAVQGGLEQCRQHFLSIREVAKENMKKWSTELDKVVSRVQDRGEMENMRKIDKLRSRRCKNQSSRQC